MSNFEDRLIGELMNEHGPALAVLERPESRRRSSRPLWMTGGALTVALGVAAVVTLTGGGGSPAYAVTQNPNGTVTLTLNEMSGIDGVNAKLRQLGLPVVVVPLRQDCPPVTEPVGPALGKMTVALNDRTFTFSTDVVPAGDMLVVGAGQASENGAPGEAAPAPTIVFSVALARKDKVPACLPGAPDAGPLRPGHGATGSSPGNSSGNSESAPGK